MDSFAKTPFSSHCVLVMQRQISLVSNPQETHSLAKWCLFRVYLFIPKYSPKSCNLPAQLENELRCPLTLLCLLVKWVA